MIRQTASRAARRSWGVSSARNCSSSGSSRCNESVLTSSRRGPEAKERELAGVLFGGGVYGIFEVDGYQGAKHQRWHRKDVEESTHQGPVSRVESGDLGGGGRIPGRLACGRGGVAAAAAARLRLLLLHVARTAGERSGDGPLRMRANASLQHRPRGGEEHARSRRYGLLQALHSAPTPLPLRDLRAPSEWSTRDERLATFFLFRRDLLLCSVGSLV